MILAFARRQSYEPGTNIAGEQAENVWLFLLPHLGLQHVVFVGTPAAGTRIACEALGASLSDATPSDLIEVASGGCDLVWISAARLPDVVADSSAIAALDRVLHAGGSVYAEPSRKTARVAAALARALHIAASFEFASTPASAVSTSRALGGRAVWLIPRSHPPRRTLGLRVARVLRGLASHPIQPPTSADLIGLGKVREGVPEVSHDQGLLVPTHTSAAQAPDYIRTAARQHGYDLDETPWSVSLQRGYRSQKVVFHLPERAEIVKVTQDPRFNHRLENEYEALRILESGGLADPSIVPRALFRARHGRLLVVGETRLEGVPFRERSNGSPSCPFARAVLDALTELASVGVGAAGGGREASEALAELLGQHEKIHGPPASHVRFLEYQLGRLARAADDVRPVFLHGDPTTLNVLVADDQIGLVDWENAEPAGLPLWDVLHFVSAYAAWGAQRAGRRWTPGVARATLLEPSPFHSMLVDAVGRYRATVGVPAEAVVPLVFTWWMVLALREATRRRPDQLDGGFYCRLLASAVEAGETPGLRRLAT
jgi:hypothetical protein